MVSLGIDRIVSGEWWVSLLPGPRDRDRRDGLQPDRRRAARPARPEAAVSVAPILARARAQHELSRRRPGPFDVLDGVDFEVQDGEILGIVGESGSGKTMTALSVTGLLPPAGRVGGGHPAAGGPARARRPRDERRCAASRSR